jgi:hypothetical protein
VKCSYIAAASRKWMRLEGAILELLSEEEVKTIDKEVGIQPETDPIFGTYKQFLKRVETSTLQILQQQPGRQGRHLS